MKAAGGHGDEVFKIVVHPKQPMLATSSADKTVRLWDLDKLAATKTLSGPDRLRVSRWRSAPTASWSRAAATTARSGSGRSPTAAW